MTRLGFALYLLLTVAPPAWGAVAFDVGNILFDATSAGTGTAYQATSTITPWAGSNKVLFIEIVWSEDPPVTVSSVTDDKRLGWREDTH